MTLTAVKVRQAKPKEKDYKLFDGKGLFLLVKKNGSKYWRLKYRYLGKEKTLAIGVYPEVSLAVAREEMEKARRLLNKENRDPMAERQLQKISRIQQTENAFEVIAREWVDINELWSDRHRKRVINSLDKDVFKIIGNRPIAEIQPPEVLCVIRKVESRDALDVASRILQRCSSVFRYAIQTGRATTNPATELKGVLRTRKVQHVASVPRSELPGLISAIERYDGNPITKYALKLLLLTFVRPGELRGARWEEFDFESEQWRIPPNRMKMGTEHIVPLSRQALAVLKTMRSITGTAELVFHGERTRLKPISENTMTFALYRLGYKGRATPHGFRATASSILNEQGFNPDAIERQLSHTERNNVRSAYTHHARYLEERQEMMQWWADYLDSVSEKGTLIRNVE
jgi:integrase